MIVFYLKTNLLEEIYTEWQRYLALPGLQY